MPVKYVAEMFCDRIAACRVYQKEKYTDASPYDYFQHSKGHLCRSEHGHGFIHPETSELLTRWLLLLKEQGEDAAFLQIRQELKVNTGQKPLSIHCVGSAFFFSVFFTGFPLIYTAYCTISM